MKVVGLDFFPAPCEVSKVSGLVSRVYFLRRQKDNTKLKLFSVRESKLFLKNEEPFIYCDSPDNFNLLLKIIDKHKDRERLLAYPPMDDSEYYPHDSPRYNSIINLIRKVGCGQERYALFFNDNNFEKAVNDFNKLALSELVQEELDVSSRN